MTKLFSNPRARMIVAAWLCAAAILSVLGAAFDLFLVPRLPQIDGHLFPIVQPTGKPRGLYRDAMLACFSIPLVKTEPGIAVKDQFAVEASFRDTWLAPHEVDAYPADNTNSPAASDTWKNRYVGEHWTKRWCFEIPEAVADMQAMRVTGYAVHSRRPFFNTETPLPSFVIPALR